MAWLTETWAKLFPDVIFYSLTVIVFLIGIFKCCRPLARNASALNHACDLLKEGAKAKLGKPVWGDTTFLGKPLQPVWRSFLHSADMGAASGVLCDVSDFVHDDSVIYDAGNESLADLIPNLCTSLGILGTFLGLWMGLQNLDLMEISSYIQLTSGISLAFMTSIVGIIGSVTFNVLYRYYSGKTRKALDRFTATFYAYGMAQPIHPTTQMLTYEREQAGALNQFSGDLTDRMGGEIHHAITDAMQPVQQSMESFMAFATRSQVEGLDYIVSRFVDRMNKSLDGQLHKLGDALSQTADGQLKAQSQLRSAVESIGQITQHIADVHEVSEQVITKFSGFVGNMSTAYQNVSDTQADTDALLSEITEASVRQTKYLSALQEYQTQLQKSFQDYTKWTSQFVDGLEERTASNNTSMEQIAMEMRASAELLRNSYNGFTESIEAGLSNALGVLSENLQGQVQQVNHTMTEMQQIVQHLDDTLRKAAETTEQGVK